MSMHVPASKTDATDADPALDARVRVALLTALIIAAVTALSLPLSQDHGFTESTPAMFVALAVGFALSERLIFHVEAQTETVSYTPSELTLAIGLLFLDPIGLLAARLVGAIAGIALWRRQPLLKLAFNLANFAMETMIAVTIFRFANPASTVVLWLSAVGALSVAMVAGGLLVAVAISQFEGGLRTRVRDQLVNTPVFYLTPAIVASAIAVPMTVDPWLGVPAFATALTLWYLIRSHGALMHRYTDLSKVHDFSRIVGDAGNLQQLAITAAERIAETSRAAHVAVRLWAADEPTDATVGQPPGVPAVLPRREDPAWQAVLAARRVRQIDRDVAKTLLGSADLDEALVGPVVDERGLLGVVIVTQRQGITTAFDEDDIARVDTMLQQLAVAARKAQFHAQIQHEATHDRLTGLPNRAFFEAWLMGEADTTGSALLLIDLNRFKEVNDAFGHHSGDVLLREIADRIDAVCGDRDLAARFGGDEFAVLAHSRTAPEINAFAAELAAAIAEPVALGAADIVCPASIGVALIADDRPDASGLLRRADLAMYDAKSRQVEVSAYSADLEQDDVGRLTLLQDLRVAIDTGAIDIHLQPQVAVDTGEVFAAEALARWTHPTRGPIDPSLFVEIAEQAGLVNQLTAIVARKAALAARQWHERGWDIGVAVNISARSLHDEQLEPMIADILRETGLEPSRLCLEITETSMVGDPVRTDRTLRRLDAMGLRISVDDFGTGHSSLVNLRHLPVSELKIDRGFVTPMLEQENDEVIVRSTIDLAHNLGLAVVAEGVESEAVLTRLHELGCEIAQGFYISEPLPPAEFAAFVASRGRDEHEAPRTSGITAAEVLREGIAATID